MVMTDGTRLEEACLEEEAHGPGLRTGPTARDMEACTGEASCWAMNHNDRNQRGKRR